MTVAIQTPDNMEDLETLTINAFKEISNSHIDQPTFSTAKPYPKNKTQKIVMYERSTPMFMLNFILPKDYYYEIFASPFDLICSVINYGKKDSLSNYLL